MPGSVLILGGSGFVGGYLRDELASGYRVDTTSSTGSSAACALDVRQLGRHESDVLGRGYDVVINCIVRRAGTLAEMFEVNVRGLVEVMARLRETPVHFIQVSSIFADHANRTLGAYALTKYLADELLLHGYADAACRITVVRFGQIFDLEGRSASSQPALAQWIRQLQNHEPVAVLAGTGSRRSYIPVQLVARAVRVCIERGLTGCHNVVPPESYTPLELVSQLAEWGGYDDADIKVLESGRPFEYVIPDGSEAFRPWLAQQDTCAEYFKRLIGRV